MYKDDVENPMVIDCLWPDYEKIDRPTRAEIEAARADEEYDLMCEDFRWRYADEAL